MRPPRLTLCTATAVALAACGPARVETDPASVELHGRGQKATVHASPFGKDGRPMPQEACAWSSSDAKVATVSARHNDATVTAAGHGRATVRCAIGGVSAEVPVTVALVLRVEVTPRELELRIQDEPLPTGLAVRAYDGDGREVQGRLVLSRCVDENVCRGDARGQLWPVSAGDTKAVFQVDDGVAEAAVHVVDARSAGARPRAVSGNPMEHVADGFDGDADGAKAGTSSKTPHLREDKGPKRNPTSHPAPTTPPPPSPPRSAPPAPRARPRSGPAGRAPARARAPGGAGWRRRGSRR
jgi:hypothetical protein